MEDIIQPPFYINIFCYVMLDELETAAINMFYVV